MLDRALKAVVIATRMAPKAKAKAAAEPVAQSLLSGASDGSTAIDFSRCCAALAADDAQQHTAVLEAVQSLARNAAVAMQLAHSSCQLPQQLASKLVSLDVHAGEQAASATALLRAATCLVAAPRLITNTEVALSLAGAADRFVAAFHDEFTASAAQQQDAHAKSTAPPPSATTGKKAPAKGAAAAPIAAPPAPGPAPEVLAAALELYAALAQNFLSCCSQAANGIMDRFVTLLQHPHQDPAQAALPLIQAFWRHATCARALLQVSFRVQCTCIVDLLMSALLLWPR